MPNKLIIIMQVLHNYINFMCYHQKRQEKNKIIIIMIITTEGPIIIVENLT